jgi:hypothetical protein
MRNSKKDIQKIRIAAIIIAAMSFPITSLHAKGRYVNAKDYGLQEGIDNTPALMRALDACKYQNASKLIIPKGIYDIYPEKAYEVYRNIANNDDGKKKIVFLLDGFRNLEIDGMGSAFICHDLMVPFDVSNSKNITIKNLSINWKTPFYLQANVITVYPESNAFDMEILKECAYEIQGDNLIYSNKKTEKTNGWYFMAPPMQKDVIWEQNINWNIWYDPTTKAPAFCDENTTRLCTWNFKLNKPAVAKELRKNVVRLTNASDELPKIGWVMVCQGVLTKNRLSPAIHISHCKDILVENVTVHHASGMAFIAERTENITLQKYKVILPKNSERLVTTTADASHFAGCKGLIVLDSCIFENMLDDGTNVHGVYAEVKSLVDDYTVGMSRGHSQQQGFDFAQAGEKIQLVNRLTLKPYASLVVVRVKNVNDFYFEVTFKEKITDILKAESVAENISCQPNVIIRNCIVRQNRARGILISTAGKVLVENNKFIKCTYAGVMTAGDANYWFESGPVKNLIIRNNLFEDQGLCVGNAPILSFEPQVGNQIDTTWYYHQNIVFENNTINTFSRILVQARSVKNFIFRNNEINKSLNYPSASDDGPVFDFSGCSDVLIDNNKYNWGKKATINAQNGSVRIHSINNENIVEKK